MLIPVRQPRRPYRLGQGANRVDDPEIRAQFPQWALKLGEDHMLDLAVLGAVSITSDIHTR